MKREYKKTRQTIKDGLIQVRIEEVYKEYLLNQASEKDKSLSTLVYDSLNKVHPMPKNWKPKQ